MTKKMENPDSANIEKLRQQLKEHREISNGRVASLRDRLKVRAEDIVQLRSDNVKAIKALKATFRDEQKSARAEYAVLNRKLTQYLETDEGKLISQLEIKNNLLKSRTTKLNEITQRIIDIESALFQPTFGQNQQFSPEQLILKLLTQGYYKRGRFQYLEFVTQKDWESLLEFFQSKSSGFEALETLRPLFQPWIQYYHGLIDIAEDRGFQIRPLEDYVDNGLQEKSLYLYHDVHAWDLIPALGMALANKDRGICTTFCLNIDQAHVDIAHEAGYRIFGTLFGENVQVGLHCNPMASWVRMDVFQANEKAFMDWYATDSAQKELIALLKNKKTNIGAFAGETRNSAMNGCFNRLETNFKKLKSFCPQARSANHHGDILNQLYKTMDRKLKEKNKFIVVPSILRDKKVKKMGIMVSPTNIREKHKPIAEIFNETQNKASYYENLHEVLGQGVTCQLINHPGAISNSSLVMNIEFTKKLTNNKCKDYPPFSCITANKVPKQPSEIKIDECDGMVGKR